MGIMHFAPVGINPGAVTSALTYLNMNEQEIRLDNPFKGKIIQDLVIFFSVENPMCQEYIWNDYGRTTHRQGWIPKSKPESVTEIIERFIKSENNLFPRNLKLYLWPVDVNNYEMCFEAIAIAVLAAGRPNSVCHHIWANITGGTNILNAALLEVSFLSGLIGRMYYVFVKNEEQHKYLNPYGDSYSLDWIWPYKTTFDEAYYEILDVFSTLKDWCSDNDLLSRLRRNEGSLPPQKRYFEKVNIDDLRDQFLNRMDGHEIERNETKTHYDRISIKGREILRKIKDPLFEALVHRGKYVEDEQLSRWRRELADKRVKLEH